MSLKYYCLSVVVSLVSTSESKQDGGSADCGGRRATRAFDASGSTEQITDCRRRVRDLKVPAYTQAEADRAAGLGVDNKQRGVEDVVKKMDETKV